MRRAPLFLAIAAMSLSGCGEERTTPVPVYPVSGTVTYKGAPVVGADITFYSDGSDRSAFGRTNDKGEYQLTTFSSNDGAVEGKQFVVISKTPPPAQIPTIAPIEDASYVPPDVGESTDPPRPKSDLPEKYATRETSDLVAMVNKDQPNVLNFELTD